MCIYKLEVTIYNNWTFRNSRYICNTAKQFNCSCNYQELIYKAWLQVSSHKKDFEQKRLLDNSIR